MILLRRLRRLGFVWWVLALLSGTAVPTQGQTVTAAPASQLGLASATIVVDPTEPSYVQYAAQDLATYLGQLAGTTAVVVPTVRADSRHGTCIVIGSTAATSLGIDLGSLDDLQNDGFVMRTVDRPSGHVIAVAGRNPHGTNSGVASLVQGIRAGGGTPYVDAPIDRRENPSYAVRGIHLNGWPLNYPHAFRAWREADWKRFIDLAWAQRINLFYLWPFMEILPTPLSSDDEAYLQEVRRVVDYAQRQRGMDVWIMQSANRIGTSDCGVRDPRMRPYWVNDCQKDMNPADPAQFARIEQSFTALYTIVNNANSYAMIDSDPGGWPQSPLSDQVKIFKAARRLLEQHAVAGTRPTLIDWMHVGWGRHKFFTSSDSVVAAYDWTDKNPDESDVAFMGETIQAFKAQVDEPWGLIAGQPPYLPVVAQEQMLARTVYLPYGAIESEPAFPATNLGQDSVRRVFTRAGNFQGLRGVMGNNQLVLLQFPRTYYFFRSAWDTGYVDRSEPDVLLDLAGQLYPEQQRLIADAFLALREGDAGRISPVVGGLEALERAAGTARLGPMGRLLFPDPLVIVRNLRMQLETRQARQAFIAAMRGKPTIPESARLVERYFDRLLAWNKETGWDKMIDITIWPKPIYEGGSDLTEAIYRLKQLLADGAPYTSFRRIDAFFTPITEWLRGKYGEDSVMIGCIEPFKLAVVQSQ